MTGRYEGPPGHDDAEPVAPVGPPSGTRVVRAAFVLVVMVVIGVLILPSATRGPRTLSTAATTTTTTIPTTTTTHPVTTTTLPVVAHQSIKVLVANGTNTAHGASEVRTWLGSHGFDTSPFPPYDTTTPQTQDAIYMVNGGTATMADEVATALALGASVVQPASSQPPVQTTVGADIIVVLGTDLATRADAGTLAQPPAASTTTTTS
jgi:hypothetical protein